MKEKKNAQHEFISESTQTTFFINTIARMRPLFSSIRRFGRCCMFHSINDVVSLARKHIDECHAEYSIHDDRFRWINESNFAKCSIVWWKQECERKRDENCLNNRTDNNNSNNNKSDSRCSCWFSKCFQMHLYLIKHLRSHQNSRRQRILCLHRLLWSSPRDSYRTLIYIMWKRDCVCMCMSITQYERDKVRNDSKKRRQ